MMTWSAVLHFMTIALAVAINSIGVGIGEGIAGFAALKAIDQQPSARNEIVRNLIVGMALIETAAVIGLTISLMLLGKTEIKESVSSHYPHLCELGITFAICLSGMVVGIASSLPAKAACLSVARQPFSSNKIQNLMLLTLSFMQTPIIFGFIIAILIRNQAMSATSLPHSLQAIAAGLCIGLGSIGPSIGLSKFAKSACETVGITNKEYGKVLSFTLISEAIIETPLIFALIVALIILNSNTYDSVLVGITFVAAGLCMGLGTIGPGTSSGRVASAACKQIAHNPENHSLTSKVSMLGQGLIDTCAVFAMITSLMLIFFSARS